MYLIRKISSYKLTFWKLSSGNENCLWRDHWHKPRWGSNGSEGSLLQRSRPLRGGRGREAGSRGRGAWSTHHLVCCHRAVPSWLRWRALLLTGRCHQCCSTRSLLQRLSASVHRNPNLGFLQCHLPPLLQGWPPTIPTLSGSHFGQSLSTEPILSRTCGSWIFWKWRNPHLARRLWGDPLTSSFLICKAVIGFRAASGQSLHLLPASSKVRLVTTPGHFCF